MKKKMEAFIQRVRRYIQYIGMEFGIEKWAMLIMRILKRHITEAKELPNQVKIKSIGEK